MLRLICNKKGISLVEVMVAIVLTAIGLVTLSSLQDSGWKAMAKADYVGRASGILYNTLQQYEANLSNPCFLSFTLGEQSAYHPTPDGTYWDPVQTSGSSTAIRGDITYRVRVIIAQALDIHGAVIPNSFRVTVTVTWTGNTIGISESLVVARQDAYKLGC